MKKYNTIVGIDPGKTGAITILKFGNPVIHKMPDTIAGLMDVLKDHTTPVAFMESVNHYPFEDPKKKFGIQKMRDQYTQTKTVLEMLQIDHLEFTANTWQRRLNIPKVKNEEYADRKTRLWNIAKNMVPKQKVFKYAADSILICKCGHDIIKADPQYFNEKAKIF